MVGDRFELIVVPHTHWDREWYLPFESYRLRLVGVARAVLDLLDRDDRYAHFMLDGQTVILEDLLEVCPELGERISRHAATGRLSIGPWYVLQDEFLVGGESLVRNLLEGRRVAERFGRPMSVGYLPDAFGHVAQMPRVLRGFGIDSAVLWRGVGDRAPGLEWRWRSPGGAEVMCLWLPFGYGIGANLPADGARARIEREVERHRPLSRTGVMLLMNGCDHDAPQENLTAVLDSLRAELPDLGIEQAGLERAVARVRERLSDADLPVISGELRRPGGGGNVLPGVLSARTWQKRDHDQAEWLLSRVAEPFAALAGLDCAAELRHGWRILMRCQPHDSICGCSADVVHDEIDVRLGRARQVALGLASRAAAALAGDRQPDSPVHRSIAFLNPHPFPYTGPVEATVEVTRDRWPFALVAEGGEVPFDLVDRRSSLQQIEHPPEPVQPLDTERVRVRALVRDLPAGGVRVVRVEPAVPGRADTPCAGVTVAGEQVDNGRVAVRAVPGGVCIVDLETGQQVTHTFAHELDCGDTYNFCPVEGDVARLSSTSETVAGAVHGAAGASLVVSGLWEVPAGLTQERTAASETAELGLWLEARLVPDCRAVELCITIDNRASDHRLRARFDADGSSGPFVADTPLGWSERRAGLPPPVDGEEDVVANHPISSLAAWRAARATVGIATVGLRDLEMDDAGLLSLTLVRAVGWLSRPDLSTRRSPAGPPVYTPGAQGQGTHQFRYVVGFDRHESFPADLIQRLDGLRCPPHAVAIGDAPAGERAGIAVEPASVRLSALKRAESGSGWVIRLVAPPSESVRARVQLDREVVRWRLSDLDERTGEPIAASGPGSVELDLPADEVVTLIAEL